MKFKVSDELIKMYKSTGKNMNYMLDYLLTSIDSKNCNKYFELISTFSIYGSYFEVEISDDNIKYIKSLFGKIDTIIYYSFCH